MKNKGLWLLFGLIAAVAIIFLFTRAPTAEPPVANKTTTEPPTPGAQPGDLVTINFAMRLENGTVVDTNNKTLAQQHGLSSYATGPYTFILGQSGKLPGFDDAITGMNVGDRRETTIEPSEDELLLNLTTVQHADRFIAMPKLQRMKIPAFKQTYGKDPVQNDIVFADNTFKAKVLNMTERTVLLELIVNEGEEYTLMNHDWPSKVAKISEHDILFYQLLKDNQTINTTFGPAIVRTFKSAYDIHYKPKLGSIVTHSVPIGDGYSIPQQFKVTDLKPGYFTIKRHGLLTDKQLTLDVTLLDNTPGVKTIKDKKPVAVEIVT